MANKEMNDLLDDIMIDHISNASVSELLVEYNLTNDEVQGTQARFLASLKEHKLTSKKAKLKNARARLEVEKNKHESIDVMSYLAQKGKDAKDVLIEMLAQQKLPENLTLAHREGKEFTDEDANQIVANLIAMGVIEVDDKGD